MLSDGHIQLRSNSSNARFSFCQSGKIEKLEYFNLVLSLFLRFCTKNYKPYLKKWKDKKTNIIYSSISLTTMQLPCFNELRNLWYFNNIKIVPKNIKMLLNNIALAHWVMGDGSYQNGGLHLSVYSFSKTDIKLLIEALEENFNLQVSVHKHEKGDRLYINKNSMEILRPQIKNYIVPSMLYKIKSQN